MEISNLTIMRDGVLITLTDKEMATAHDIVRAKRLMEDIDTCIESYIEQTGKDYDLCERDYENMLNYYLDDDEKTTTDDSVLQSVVKEYLG